MDAKIENVKTKTTNEQTQKYLDLAEKTLTQCIQSTTETFVSEVKKSGEFTKETGSQAFIQSKEAFLSTISTEVETAIKDSYGDMDKWIEVAIESILADQKNTNA